MIILCWLLDHKWKYRSGRDRECKRCKRTEYFEDSVDGWVHYKYHP